MTPTIRRAVGAAAAALLGATVAVPTAEADQSVRAGAATATASTTSFTIGTYNIQASRSLTEFRTAIKAYLPQVDVAGLQEIAGAARNDWLAASQDWRVWRAPHLGQVPIVWDPDVFDFEGGTEYLLADGRQIEGKDGALVWKDSSYAAVARLRHAASGEVISVVNVHLIHGAVKRGLPVPGKPLTYDYYTDQVAALKEALVAEAGLGHRAYATGDFNVGYEADQRERVRKLPYRRLSGIGLTAIWKDRRLRNHGTHIDRDCPDGRRQCGAYIDQIWGPGASATAQVLTDLVHSDHYPVVASYELPVPAGYVPPTGTIGFADTDLSIEERNRPFQVRDPLRFELTGDLRHGYARVEVAANSATGTATEGEDFTIDLSSWRDNDLGTN